MREGGNRQPHSRTYTDKIDQRLDAVEQKRLEGVNTVLKDLLLAQPPEGDGDGR